MVENLVYISLGYTALCIFLGIVSVSASKDDAKLLPIFSTLACSYICFYMPYIMRHCLEGWLFNHCSVCPHMTSFEVVQAYGSSIQRTIYVLLSGIQALLIIASLFLSYYLPRKLKID